MQHFDFKGAAAKTRCHFTPRRMAVINIDRKQERWRGCGGPGPLRSGWGSGDGNWYTGTLGRSLVVPSKVLQRVILRLALPPPGTCPPERKTGSGKPLRQNVHGVMNAGRWQPPACPGTDEGTGEAWRRPTTGRSSPWGGGLWRLLRRGPAGELTVLSQRGQARGGTVCSHLCEVLRVVNSWI